MFQTLLSFLLKAFLTFLIPTLIVGFVVLLGTELINGQPDSEQIKIAGRIFVDRIVERVDPEKTFIHDLVEPPAIGRSFAQPEIWIVNDRSKDGRYSYTLNILQTTDGYSLQHIRFSKIGDGWVNRISIQPNEIDGEVTRHLTRMLVRQQQYQSRFILSGVFWTFIPLWFFSASFLRRVELFADSNFRDFYLFFRALVVGYLVIVLPLVAWAYLYPRSGTDYESGCVRIAADEFMYRAIQTLKPGERYMRLGDPDYQYQVESKPKVWLHGRPAGEPNSWEVTVKTRLTDYRPGSSYTAHFQISYDHTAGCWLENAHISEWLPDVSPAGGPTWEKVTYGELVDTKFNVVHIDCLMSIHDLKTWICFQTFLALHGGGIGICMFIALAFDTYASQSPEERRKSMEETAERNRQAREERLNSHKPSAPSDPDPGRSPNWKDYI